MASSYKYIYGPVPSWRLGRSLGVDPISMKDKICTFDCIYCQLDKTGIFSNRRKVFVPAKELINEIKSFSVKGGHIDYITFSGRGEPTLAKNLGDMIKQIKKIRKEKIAVITDASLINRKDVKEDLMRADLVMVKLDACSEYTFLKINRPMKGMDFYKIIGGIKAFRRVYKGKMALQIMFVEENKLCAGPLADLAREIQADEAQINTPLRQCGVKPLSKEEITRIKKYFTGMNVVSVYDVEKKNIKPAVSKEYTIKRRGND